MIPYWDKIWVNLIGQKRAKKLLGASLVRNHIVHNYLFEGPIGAGKFPFAISFARSLVCSNRNEMGSCNQCEDCRLFNIGSHPDALVMSRESELNAEEARRIRDLVMLSPQRANGKVIVLDGMDRVHPTAGNILLKTLEEAPGGSIFILTAHRADKLLPTILSRSLRIPFYLLPISELADEYGRVLRVDSEKARIVSELSGGRPGWGIRFLLHPEFQELYNYGKKIISETLLKLPLSSIFHKESVIMKFMDRTNIIFSERDDIKGMDGESIAKLLDGSAVNFRPVNLFIEESQKTPRHLDALGLVLLGGIFRSMLTKGEIEGSPIRYIRLLEGLLEAPRLLERYFNRDLVIERFVLRAHGRFGV